MGGSLIPVAHALPLDYHYTEWNKCNRTLKLVYDGGWCNHLQEHMKGRSAWYSSTFTLACALA